VTLALKNIAMSYLAADYYSHPRLTQHHRHWFFEDMHSFIAAMARRFPIHLAVTVRHPAMIGTGPLGGYAAEAGLVIDVRPLPAAIGTVLGDPVTPRTDRSLNGHVEQGHRGTEQRHSPTGGLKSFVSAARLCLVFDEIRTHLSP
jgi:hypothetical protein